MSESWGVCANCTGDRLIRKGARVVILQQPGSPERYQVKGLSLGGRKITKWVNTKHLSNFRPFFSVNRDSDCAWWNSKEEAKKAAEYMAWRINA